MSKDRSLLAKRLLRLSVPQFSWAVIYYMVFTVIGMILNVIRIPNDFVIRFTKKDLLLQALFGSDRYLCPKFWYPLGRLAESLPFAVAGVILMHRAIPAKIRKQKYYAVFITAILIMLLSYIKIIPDPECGFDYCGIQLIIFTICVFILIRKADRPTQIGA